MNNLLKFTILFIIGASIFSACSDPAKSDQIITDTINSDTVSFDTKSQVTVDHEFTDIFHRTGEGFTGGDGTYSVELPDGRTIWIFGDTFLGAVNADNTRTKTNPIFIRNSITLLNGEEFHTLYNDTSDENRSLMIPPHVVNSGYEITEKEQWYWPGDGFIENNQLKVFSSEFHQVDVGMWDFQWKGTALVSFSLPDLKQTGIVTFDYGIENNVHYGHAVLEDGDFTYIYGLSEGKPHVARAPKGNIEGDWEFYTGSAWDKDPTMSQPMAQIDGSEQFTILKLDEKYYFITQLGGFSKEICSFESNNPFSEWDNKKVIYITPIEPDSKDIFTYNAVAHPQFINEKGLLISYNTNSFELEDHYRDAGIYRPRFIRIPISLIKE